MLRFHKNLNIDSLSNCLIGIAARVVGVVGLGEEDVGDAVVDNVETTTEPYVIVCLCRRLRLPRRIASTSLLGTVAVGKTRIVTTYIDPLQTGALPATFCSSVHPSFKKVHMRIWCVVPVRVYLFERVTLTMEIFRTTRSAPSTKGLKGGCRE